MNTWKKVIGLIFTFYIVIIIFGLIENRMFDVNQYNGYWSGTRNIQLFGKGNHTQYHYINFNNGNFEHSVQNPLGGENMLISSGKIEKTVMSQILPDFQKDVDFEIINIEKNADGTIFSFCVIRKGGQIDECDIRFIKR